eukprot:7991178-Pyramimonas_sp.AAC.2
MEVFPINSRIREHTQSTYHTYKPVRGLTRRTKRIDSFGLGHGGRRSRAPFANVAIDNTRIIHFEL